MKAQYIDECMENMGNRYKLCTLVAKRAGELVEYLSAQRRMERTKIIKPLANIKSRDPLEIAFYEVKEGKVVLKEEV